MEDQLRNGFVRHLMVGLEGTSLSKSERTLLSQDPPAGVIIFSRNVADSGQLRRLSSEIRKVIFESSGLPPLIAADHEGGRISVLARAICAPPPQMAIARTRDLSLCRRLFRETAQRMRSCGVNMVLGPVADINSEYLNPVIGTRSFGDDTDEVAVLVSEAVTAFREGGLLTCLKHFPGHGATVHDSHLTLPQLGRSIDQLKDKDTVPFARGIEAGADAVLVGHIAPLGRMIPATLDPEIVSRLLRRDIGFTGCVMTDALEMAGVRVSGSHPHREGGGHDSRSGGDRPLGEIIRRALEAGDDLLLFSRPIGEVYRELQTLTAGSGVDIGFQERWTDRLRSSSAERIAKLRSRIEALEVERGISGRSNGEGLGEIDTVGRTEDVATETLSTYGEVAAKSVQVLRDPRSVLPISGSSNMYLSFCGERRDFENEVVGRFISRVLERTGIAVIRPHSGIQRDEISTVIGDLKPRMRFRMPHLEEFLELFEFRAGEDSNGSTNVLFLLNRRPVSREALFELCARMDVVVIAGWPYAMNLLDDDKTVVVSYGVYDAAADVVCEVRI